MVVLEIWWKCTAGFRSRALVVQFLGHTPPGSVLELKGDLLSKWNKFCHWGKVFPHNGSNGTLVVIPFKMLCFKDLWYLEHEQVFWWCIQMQKMPFFLKLYKMKYSFLLNGWLYGDFTFEKIKY